MSARRPPQQPRSNKLDRLKDKLLSGISVPEAAQFVPDQFQLDAVQSLVDGFDTLVVAPTGSGKTWIATQAIREFLKRGKRAVYTAPLKALSNSKYIEMKKLFEPEYRVGILTGDRKIEGDANLVVATTEIYRNELFDFSENYSLVVLDEFHYLADPQRGPVWEESVILAPLSSTLLMLSASISNPDQISAWITEVRAKQAVVVQSRTRPVELRLAFYHPQNGVIPLLDDAGNVHQLVQNYYEAEADAQRMRPKQRGRRRGWKR